MSNMINQLKVALKWKVELKLLHSGAIFMSTKWHLFRYRFRTSLQSGTVFNQKKSGIPDWKKTDYGSCWHMVPMEKMAPLSKQGTVFPKKFLNESNLAPFFFSVKYCVTENSARAPSMCHTAMHCNYFFYLMSKWNVLKTDFLGRKS